MAKLRMDSAIYGTDVRIVQLACEQPGVTAKTVSQDKIIKNTFEHNGPREFTPNRARAELERLVRLDLLKHNPKTHKYVPTGQGVALSEVFRK